MTQEQRIRRGESAKQLLNDPLLSETFDALEAYYITTWKRSDDIEEREKMHAQLHALWDIRQEIDRYITDGTMAQSRVGTKNL